MWLHCVENNEDTGRPWLSHEISSCNTPLCHPPLGDQISRTQICVIYQRRLPHMALPFSLDSQETITDPSISPSTDTHHPTLAVHHTAVNCPAAYPQVLRPVQRAPNDPLKGMFNLLASPKHVFSEVSSGTKWRQCCRHCHPWLAYCHPRNPRGS